MRRIHEARDSHADFSAFAEICTNDRKHRSSVKFRWNFNQVKRICTQNIPPSGI